MIFNLYPRVVVKIGDERHEFDRARLMYTEVAEIEKVTGQSYGEWEQALSRYSIGAVAALLHILRKRDGTASDYARMEFNAADLDVVPLHDDGMEYTAAEVAADLAKRMAEAADKTPVPTAAAVAATGQIPAVTTSESSPNGSASGRGNGSTSPTPTSSPARRTSTRR